MSLKKIYRRIFPRIEHLLKNELKDCKTILELGCGSASPLRLAVEGKYVVGVDGHRPSLEISKKSGSYKKLVKADIRQISKIFAPGSFDCVVALDVIEHLKKEDGRVLLRDMEKIASKKVIILTPNGFVPQYSSDGNRMQEHLSGWKTEDFLHGNYEVHGFNGAKSLRKGKAETVIKPDFFGNIISDLSQIFVKAHPEKAFHLLCIKKIGEKND